MSCFQPCLIALDGNSPANFRQYQKYVVNHPFFLMSQRCHELFFSGMFAWMINKYPGFAEAFFGKTINWAKQKPVVTEEEGWRDITIKLEEDEFYVIENKFKCSCDVGQLRRYSDNLRNYSDDECSLDEHVPCLKAGVVLGVSDNEPERLPHPWEYKSYHEILAGLWRIYVGIKDTRKFSSFDKLLIEEFLKFLDGVLSVLNPFKPVFGEGHWPIVCPSKLKEKGLVTLMERMHAMSLADYLNNFGDFSSAESTFSVRANDGSVLVESCELWRPQCEPLKIVIEISKKFYKRKIIPREVCQLPEWSKRMILQRKPFDHILAQIKEDISVAENHIQSLSESGWKIASKRRTLWCKEF